MVIKEKKMKAFRDYLGEQFKNKGIEEKFYKRLEKERIAAEILFYREKLNLTQEDLAKKIDTSQSAIARLEDSDYRGYSIKVLRKIAAALGLELVVTFREKEDLKYEKDPVTIIMLSNWPKRLKPGYKLMPSFSKPCDRELEVA
jgi:transcriptional regulator with XRE-family HTH domain